MLANRQRQPPRQISDGHHALFRAIEAENTTDAH